MGLSVFVAWVAWIWVIYVFVAWVWAIIAVSVRSQDFYRQFPYSSLSAQNKTPNTQGCPVTVAPGCPSSLRQLVLSTGSTKWIVGLALVFAVLSIIAVAYVGTYFLAHRDMDQNAVKAGRQDSSPGSGSTLNVGPLSFDIPAGWKVLSGSDERTVKREVENGMRQMIERSQSSFGSDQGFLGTESFKAVLMPNGAGLFGACTIRIPSQQDYLTTMEEEQEQKISWEKQQGMITRVIEHGRVKIGESEVIKYDLEMSSGVRVVGVCYWSPAQPEVVAGVFASVKAGHYTEVQPALDTVIASLRIMMPEQIAEGQRLSAKSGQTLAVNSDSNPALGRLGDLFPSISQYGNPQYVVNWTNFDLTAKVDDLFEFVDYPATTGFIVPPTDITVPVYPPGIGPVVKPVSPMARCGQTSDCILYITDIRPGACVVWVGSTNADYAPVPLCADYAVLAACGIADENNYEYKYLEICEGGAWRQSPSPGGSLVYFPVLFYKNRPTTDACVQSVQEIRSRVTKDTVANDDFLKAAAEQAKHSKNNATSP